MLSNLINNALKFTTAGSVTVRVTLRKEQNDEAFIRFLVNDTGIGIQPEEKKFLFKAFSQLDTNFSRQYEGAGLGLAISKRIIELMHGRIGVESLHSKGASFWFEIPCKTGYEAHGFPGAALVDRSVLLFDLQPMSRLAIRNYFLSWQADLYLAKSEQELYERLADKTLKFDLVVISLGYEATSHKSVEKILQNVSSQYRGKVILLVFSNYQNLKNLYVFRGDVMILEKPIRKHKLFERIMGFLNISSNKQQLQKKWDIPGVAKSSVKELPVLVAEDNEFNAILISAMLEERGYKVICRSSGKEILSLLPDKKIILFLIDIHMPDMDGYELVSKCRREKLISDKVPVIAFTADIMLRKIDSLRGYGFNDVLYKPVSNENLDRLLSKWIEHKPDIVNNTQQSTMLNSFDLKQKLNDDIRHKIIYLKKNINSLEAADVAEQIHQLEGLLGYFQFNHLLLILNELKQAILDKDRNNTHLKLELLESETIAFD